MKHAIQMCSITEQVNHVWNQLDAGHHVKDITFKPGLSDLRDLHLGWVMDGHKALVRLEDSIAMTGQGP